MTSFTIKDFPMPPSANTLYANIPGKGRVKTKDYRLYEESVRIWSFRTAHHLQTARVIISRLPKGQALHLDRRFYFERGKIITKGGRPRRNDTSNRIKALDDVLAAILGCDDSLFWSGSETKVQVCNIVIGESVDITFSAVDIETSKLI